MLLKKNGAVRIRFRGSQSILPRIILGVGQKQLGSRRNICSRKQFLFLEVHVGHLGFVNVRHEIPGFFGDQNVTVLKVVRSPVCVSNIGSIPLPKLGLRHLDRWSIVSDLLILLPVPHCKYPDSVDRTFLVFQSWRNRRI
jgi:hypothetical protein